MQKLIAAVMACFFVAGCSNKITEFVDKKFPPVTEDQQRTTATNAIADALLKIHTSSIGLGVSIDDLNAVSASSDLKNQGVTSIKLTGDRQLLRVDVTFDKTFEAKDGGTNNEVAKLLESLQPHVKGKVTVFAGLTGEVVDKPDLPILQLKLLPSLSMVKVDKVDVKGSFDLTKAGEAIVGVLNKYKDNISGELSRSALTSVTVPLLSKASINLSQTIKVDSSPAQGTVVATAQPVTVPYKLDGIAWLIAEKQITVLVQMIPTTAAPHADSPKVPHNYDTIGEAFKTHLTEDLGVPDGSGTWVAIRKDVMASAINSVVAQAALCVAPTISVANQHSESKITLPSGLGIDCTPTKVCGERQCTFDRHSDDTTNCDKCAAYALRVCAPRTFFGPGGCTGGQCIQRWNEPTCELAKATQNQIYLADATLRKADCDRIAGQEKLACEAEKTGTKALCEVKKEALNALARTGKFANLDVDASVQTKGMRICIKDFNLSTGLDKLQFALDVQGSAEAKVNVKFVPLGIVGHIACVMDWSKEHTFKASLRDSRIGISSDISLENQDEGFYANAVIKGIPVKANLSPGPTEYLLKSPELLLKCPVLPAVAPTVLTLTPFVPVLKGDIDYQLSDQKLSIKLAVPEQKLADQRLKITLSSNPMALVAQGAYKAP